MFGYIKIDSSESESSGTAIDWNKDLCLLKGFKLALELCKLFEINLEDYLPFFTKIICPDSKGTILGCFYLTLKQICSDLAELRLLFAT